MSASPTTGLTCRTMPPSQAAATGTGHPSLQVLLDACPALRPAYLSIFTKNSLPILGSLNNGYSGRKVPHRARAHRRHQNQRGLLQSSTSCLPSSKATMRHPNVSTCPLQALPTLRTEIIQFMSHPKMLLAAHGVHRVTLISSMITLAMSSAIVNHAAARDLGGPHPIRILQKKRITKWTVIPATRCGSDRLPAIYFRLLTLSLSLFMVYDGNAHPALPTVQDTISYALGSCQDLSVLTRVQCDTCEPRSYLVHDPMHIFLKLPRPVDRPIKEPTPLFSMRFDSDMYVSP